MNTAITPTNIQEPFQLPVQAKLAACWTSFMFLYAYVDILSLFKPGAIDDVLAGVVWELQITQAFLIGALVLVAIPIMMIPLSIVLPPRANRTVNLVVAALYIPVSAFNAVGETWTYFYATSIGLELVLLVAILRYAWTWSQPREATHARSERPRHAAV